MKKIIFITLLAASLFGLISVLSAQEDENGTVQGSIFQDTNGDGLCQDQTPLGGVSVSLQLDGTNTQSVSDQNGNYFVNLPAQGRWSVNVFSVNRLWGVVSSHPLQIDVSASSGLSKIGVNFCMQRVTNNGNVLTNDGITVSLPAVINEIAQNKISTAQSLSEQSTELLTNPPESIQPDPEQLEDIQSTPLTEEAVPVAEWLGYVNNFRRMAGVSDVTESSELTVGALSHARYMVVHDRPIAHAESPEYALYSEAGHIAAANGLIFATSQLQADHTWAANFWASAPFHLIPLIDPNLQSVGYGNFNQDVGTFKMAGVIDVGSGLEPSSGTIEYPIMFPADGEETWVLRHSLFEWPNPIPSCPGYSRPSGPPIVLLLGNGDITPRVNRFAVKEDGKPLDVCMFNETNFASPNASEQSVGRTILGLRDAIVLMPRNPLVVNSEYAVEIETNGELHSWSFTTRKGP
ncbi:MAG: CAP domain-containing protein [Anaerolineae bacterium]